MIAMFENEPVENLSDEECWALLADEQLGRLAFHLVDELHVVPLNYAVLDGRLLMRTTSGSKLLAAALGSEVALEIDGRSEDEAWSVVAHGRLRILEEDEQERVEPLMGEPWISRLVYDVIELCPDSLTGRRFLRRPATAD
jgi:nitroimidazol reductase NimA-like FMN-containing flavoprotein (pyridoxamine 5'-phosphate oxidase superfamily)